jgi:hypothetical protein
MGHPIRVNRNVRILALAAALIPAFLSGEAIAGPDVTVTNVPLPITGTVAISGVPSVRLALPTEPFSGAMTFTATDGFKAVGVPGRRLAVTTITISNYNDNMEEVFLFNPSITGSGCESGTVGGGSRPTTNVILEPFKSLQLQYPVPMVFEPVGGLGCIAAGVSTTHAGAVIVDVIGFTVAP